MTNAQVATAIKEGIPFIINMADGKSYQVNDRMSVALGTTSVVVMEEDLAHWLPLLTMTGITYLKSAPAGESSVGR